MKSTLRSGDWVEVRSKEEILSTLDANGQLDGMLWMPEMFQFCGQRFEVFKRAHKSCDYTTPYPFSSRWVEKAVLLNTRCDGSAHDGCQAGCMIFWKEAWLKPVPGNAGGVAPLEFRSNGGATAVRSGGCSEAVISNRTRVTDPADNSTRFVCQTTELPKASKPLAWWDLRQYIEDVQSGNVSVRRMMEGFVYSMYYNVSHAGIGVGPIMGWLYDKLHWIWKGTLFPRKVGLIPDGQPTPVSTLNLEPGELVRVKDHLEILKTINVSNVNRGMYWDAELVPYCGGTYRVLRRITKIINEQTGKMMEMKTPCITLDTVTCQARYSPCRMFCPRAMYPYWREIWLERVSDGSDATTAPARS